MEKHIMSKLLELIEKETGVTQAQIDIHKSLNFDYKIDGDDAVELLERISEEFALDLSNFDFYRYFNDEASLGFNILKFAYLKSFKKIKKEPILIVDLIKIVECSSSNCL